MTANPAGFRREGRFSTRMLVALSTTVVLLLAPPLFAQSVQGDLGALLRALPHQQTVASACVLELRSGETLFTHEADRPLIPASTLKLFAMAAALAELGPGFHFETVMATDRTNLLIIGDGDPAFGDEKLCKARNEAIAAEFSRWADALLGAGVSAIPGDLILDESIFDTQRTHPTWEPGDLGKWYAAPVGGLNYNDNCVDITVRPADRQGAPVLVFLQPRASVVEIVNQCRTGQGTPLLHHRAGTFEYRITGRCNRPWPFGSVAFPDPGLLFADSLRVVLADRGISISGDIRRRRVRRPNGGLPQSLTVIARHRTAIDDVLLRAGKDSQNLFAECLLKRAGYAWAKRRGHSNPRGTWAFGANAVAELAHRAGIDGNGLVILDGSGLSRDNACTARQLAQLLAWARTRPWSQLFHDSLATAGEDGSLHRRLRDVAGAVYAKTGTMRSVRALAGYVDGDSGPRFAFAVLFNGYPGPSTPYREIQDEFCRVLIDATGSDAGRPATGR